MGASTQEVEKAIRSLQEWLNQVGQGGDTLVESVQNLETIVTSEAWDALQDSTSDAASMPETPDSVELDSPPSGKRNGG
jgi:hypothetical protein